MIRAVVHLELSGLERFRHEVSKPQGPIRDALRQWGHRYRTFVQRRFVKYSRGGGDWPPLKYKRRRGSRARAAILRDTGTLFRALDPVWRSNPGAIQQDLPFGIRVGYGGPHRHPKAGISIADLAAIHDQGLGRMPKRQIIVQPDNRTRAQMVSDMQRALKKLADGV